MNRSAARPVPSPRSFRRNVRSGGGGGPEVTESLSQIGKRLALSLGTGIALSIVPSPESRPMMRFSHDGSPNRFFTQFRPCISLCSAYRSQLRCSIGRRTRRRATGFNGRRGKPGRRRNRRVAQIGAKPNSMLWNLQSRASVENDALADGPAPAVILDVADD